MEDRTNILRFAEEAEVTKAIRAKIEYCVESTIPATPLKFKGFLKNTTSPGMAQFCQMDLMREEHILGTLLVPVEVLERDGQVIKINFSQARRAHPIANRIRATIDNIRNDLGPANDA